MSRGTATAAWQTDDALDIVVPIAAAAVARAPARLVTVGLGSCVAIVLHSARERIGALAHVLLPEAVNTSDVMQPARFADLAVPHLLRALADGGAEGPFEARLVGGASMFSELLPHDERPLGSRNVEAARRACALAGVPIVGEETGGRVGRSVRFDLADGLVRVRSVASDDRLL
jgi:chemotaxis protein CheD